MPNKILFYTSASNKLEAGGRDGGAEWYGWYCCSVVRWYVGNGEKDGFV